MEIFTVPRGQKTLAWIEQWRDQIPVEGGLPWALLASGLPGHTMQGIIHKKPSQNTTNFLCGLQRKKPGPQPCGTTLANSTPPISLAEPGGQQKSEK